MTTSEDFNNLPVMGRVRILSKLWGFNPCHIDPEGIIFDDFSNEESKVVVGLMKEQYPKVVQELLCELEKLEKAQAYIVKTVMAYFENRTTAPRMIEECTKYGLDRERKNLWQVAAKFNVLPDLINRKCDYWELSRINDKIKSVAFEIQEAKYNHYTEGELVQVLISSIDKLEWIINELERILHSDPGEEQ
jgi:hypothetical protein